MGRLLIRRLRRPDATLAQIPLLLSDPALRARIIGTARDPLALDSFWIWFNKLSEYKRTDITGPVLNKLRDFLLRKPLIPDATTYVDRPFSDLYLRPS